MDTLIAPAVLYPVNLIHIAYLAIVLFGLVAIGDNARISSLRIILLLVVLLLVFNLLEESGIFLASFLVTPIFTLGFGPAFYWFCRQLVYGDALDSKKVLLHLSPMLLALAFTQWPQAVIATGSLSQIIYLSLALRLIGRYHKVTVQTCSNPEDVSIHWMTWILTLFLLMMLQDLVRLNLQPLVPIEWLKHWYFLNTSVYATLTSYLIVMAIRQPELFERFGQLEFLAEKTEETVSLDDQNAISLFQKVDSTIRKHELFKQPRFSLRDLATETGIQEKTLSWIINHGAKKNFSEYINQLRIDAACKQLIETPSRTVLEIAFAVGFNSKSTFNAVFKKQTGLTPSQFCKTSGFITDINCEK